MDVKFKFGNEVDLPAIEEGSLLFTTDDGNIYLDAENKRVKVGSQVGTVTTDGSDYGQDDYTDIRGEIFNDYGKNRALAPGSHAEGTRSITKTGTTVENIAGCKCYEVQAKTEALGAYSNPQLTISDDRTSGVIYLKGHIMNDTANQGSGAYAAGDVFSLITNVNCDNCGEITGISETTIKVGLLSNKTVNVTKIDVTFYPNKITSLETGTTVLSLVPFIFKVNEKPLTGNIVVGLGAHTEGVGNQALADGAHAEGRENKSIGRWSHTEGTGNIAAYAAHAEGWNCEATGETAHAEGRDSKATGYSAHAEGRTTKATGSYAHSEGFETQARASRAHAEGESTIASGAASHTGGVGAEATHYGAFSHGQYTKATKNHQFVVGTFNEVDNDAMFIVGDGWTDENRRNAVVVKNGDAHIRGNVIAAGKNLNQSIDNLQSDLISLENAVETANERLTNDVDILYQENKELENKTTIQLGELPAQGELDKLYVGENESYIYKVRKTPKVENIWDGVVPTDNPFPTDGSKGTGTEEDPYQITNGNELAYVVFYTTGKYSKLMNDIVLNDLDKIDWSTGEVLDKNYTINTWNYNNDEYYNKFFNGVFDGCNCTVYGMYYNNPDDIKYTTNTAGEEIINKYVGHALFPAILNNFSTTPIVIKNIGLDYAYVSSSTNAGALISVTQSANYEIKNCYVGINVKLIGTYVASIHTMGNGKALIENCYSLATQDVVDNDIVDSTKRNSFAQANWWTHTPTGEDRVTDVFPTFRNCYALNTMLNNSTNSNIIVENCYCTVAGKLGTVVTKENMTGINALDNMPNLIAYIEGGKQAIGKNKLEYLGDIPHPTYGFGCVQLDDGGLNICAYGNSPDEEAIDFNNKLFKISNYSASKQYTLSSNWIDNSVSIKEFVSFNITSDGYVCATGTIPNGFGGDTAIAYVQVEEGTEATEWEKPVIVEIEEGYNYTNDYTYPHLASFAEGYVSVGSKCEVTQEDLDEVKSKITRSTLKGDVNGDGVINQADLDLLTLYINNNLPEGVVIYLDNADMNDDGIVNTFDMSLLKLFINNGFDITITKKQLDEAMGDINSILATIVDGGAE